MKKMNTYRQALKKVGIALIIVGSVDIAVMIYCIINRINYSSFFNIFAVIAGVFLFRGGLKTALFVSWFSAFFLCGIVGILLIVPVFMPFDLIFTYLKLRPLSVIVPTIFGIFTFAFLFWIYKSLTAANIFEAMDEKSINRKALLKKPTTGFIAGGCLIVLLVVLLSLMMGGETAEQAKIKAQQEIGNDYKFTVTALSYHSTVGGKTQITADVIAYNDKEIKHMPLSWEK